VRRRNPLVLDCTKTANVDGGHLLVVQISEKRRNEILSAQSRQVMVNIDATLVPTSRRTWN